NSCVINPGEEGSSCPTTTISSDDISDFIASVVGGGEDFSSWTSDYCADINSLTCSIDGGDIDNPALGITIVANFGDGGEGINIEISSASEVGHVYVNCRTNTNCDDVPYDASHYAILRNLSSYPVTISGIQFVGGYKTNGE